MLVGYSWLCHLIHFHFHFHFTPVGEVWCSVWWAQLQRSRSCATATSGGIFPYWDQCAASRRCSGESFGGRTSVRSKFRSLQVQMVLQVLRCFKIFKMLFTNCRDILIGGFKSFCFQPSLTEMLILNEGHHFLAWKQDNSFRSLETKSDSDWNPNNPTESPVFLGTF